MRTSQPKSDNRRLLVLGAFIVLGIGALFLRWWGVGLGLALLGWAIAGALGKTKGPIDLVFPQSVRTTVLAMVGIGLGSFVTMCGTLGGVAAIKRAEKEAIAAKAEGEKKAAAAAAAEERAADEAAAKAAHEEKLRKNAGAAAIEHGAALDVVEALIAAEQWVEADAKMKEAGSLAQYRKLDPAPEEILAVIGRQDTLTPKLDAKRKEREIVAWIEQAENVTSDKTSCKTKEDVDAARKQVGGLDDSHPSYATVQELNAKLDECHANMPPPSKWRYSARNDAMGDSVATATVDSSNSFDFDFPYQGTQYATLMIRKEKGTDVLLSIEQGQFMCTLGCSVMVRFDDGKAVRWRATGTSDHSTTTIFLRKESKFVKALSKADVVRIESDFYQEGSRVLEFPVSRFDPKKLK